MVDIQPKSHGSWEASATELRYIQIYVLVSSCQLVIDASGGNAPRQIHTSSHQRVPGPEARSCLVRGGMSSHGYKEPRTQNLTSGVTGLKSSVVIELRKENLFIPSSQ